MRRLVIVAGIWILLFAATVTFNLLSGEGRATADVVGQDSASDVFDDVLRHLAQTELAAKPRKTQHGTPGSAPGSNKLQDQQLDSELRRVILENQERFRGCATGTLAGVKRPNEYFEISFLLRKEESDNAFRMDDLVFERTSVAFTAAEERCMLDVLRELRFVPDSPPAERIFYELCFNRPSHPAKSVNADSE